MKADFHHSTLASLAYQDQSPEIDAQFKELGLATTTVNN